MRRIHLPSLTTGTIGLSADQAHHLRDVLRLQLGQEVEAFDDAGNSALATIAEMSSSVVALRIGSIVPARVGFRLTIASAVPKASRADWMIEKLSELGVYRFIPLETERSVSLPRGEGKPARWNRLATEAAKQSRRQGVMQIDPLTRLADLLESNKGMSNSTWSMTTESEGVALTSLIEDAPGSVMLLIGPEGGWTQQEIETFNAQGIPRAKLTRTVLRIETAAIAAAAVVACAVRGQQD